MFVTFLTAVSAQSTGLEFETQGFLRYVLKKCLIHNSIEMRFNWNHLSDPIPKLHIRKILYEFPNMPLLEDTNKRLTLHHASDSNTASYEAVTDAFEASPKAASVRDPVTNLYPFMLAGVHGNTDASFRLLLANHTLIFASKQTVSNKTDDSKRMRT